MLDMCGEDGQDLCKTISEFSRQCVHAGGKPQPWRTENFCCKGSFKCSSLESVVVVFFPPAELFVTYTATFMCLSPQTRSVHTTCSSLSVQVHVRTAAPTLRPARHVTATAMMAAAALPVATHILHYETAKHTQSHSWP